MLVLPSQDFFVPTTDFLQFIKKEIGSKIVVECGCGNGLFATELIKMNCSVVPIDLNYRDSDFHVIIADATTFTFPRNSIAIIARPSGGDWIWETIVNALQSTPYVLYIGVERNLERDIFCLNELKEHFGLDVSYEKIYDNAGKDGEVVYKISKAKTMGKETETYCLVKYVIGANSKATMQSWFIDDGNKWKGYTGSWMPKSKNDIVLETQEVEDHHELDWKKTTIYKTDSTSGWLSRSGEFYGCNYMEHDLIADLILNKEVGGLEKEGWLRIQTGEFISIGTRISQEQYDYCISHKIDIPESCQVLMS